MRPEAADYLKKARDYVEKACDWLEAVHYGDEAARAAYLAAFHAAQALIFERTIKVAKTHRGVRASFSRLAEQDPRIDETLTGFLARGYQRKEVVDYGIGPQTFVSETEAREMIETARRFVGRVAEILAEEPV